MGRDREEEETPGLGAGAGAGAGCGAGCGAGPFAPALEELLEAAEDCEDMNPGGAGAGTGAGAEGAGCGAGPRPWLEVELEPTLAGLDAPGPQDAFGGQFGHVHVPFGPQIGPPQKHQIIGGQLQLRSFGAQEEAEPPGAGAGAGLLGAGPVFWKPWQPPSPGLSLQHCE